MTDAISEAHASGEEIFELVSKIEPALYGVERGKALIACLSLAVTIMNPDIEPQQLQEAVSGASKWICLFISGRDYQGVIPKEKLN